MEFLWKCSDALVRCRFGEVRYLVEDRMDLTCPVVDVCTNYNVCLTFSFSFFKGICLPFLFFCLLLLVVSPKK